MKVLHVAPLNVAGVPYLMMDMQRRFGADARLVTLHRSTHTFPEDICLDLHLPRNAVARWWRKKKRVTSTASSPLSGNHLLGPPTQAPKNGVESIYFRYDDYRRKNTIEEAIERFQLDQYEIIHYDGGVDFFRDCRLASDWKVRGKRIVCHYMGSDLRVRGVIPAMDRLSELNLTNESDHLLLHPNIHYIFIPFDATGYSLHVRASERLRIIHSPTNRAMKGTEFILPVVDAVRKVRDVEFILAENLPHEKVLEIKQTCDIAIEQVGNLGGTGYGRNSLETLALGIPTITEMTPDYVAWLPENPFVLANRETLYDALLRLIDNASLREEYSIKGRTWVKKYHSYESVHERLVQLYREHNIV
jgi:hypothetical protein